MRRQDWLVEGKTFSSERQRNYQGFTLIETLVAIAVLGICLVTILQLFSGGLRSNRVSGEYTRAILFAREKMEEILLASEISPRLDEGELPDGYTWHAEILQVDSMSPPNLRNQIDLYQITVDIRWGNGELQRHFDLSTLRIAARQKSSS